MSKGAGQSVRSESRREFFIQIPSFLEYLPDLDPFAWRLYVHYLRVCGESDSCYEYNATTARLCNMSARTMRYRRQVLADLNLISFWYEGEEGDERVNVIVRDVWGINARFLRLIRSKSLGEWVVSWIRDELAKMEPTGEIPLSEGKHPLAPDARGVAPNASPLAPNASPLASGATIERSLRKIPDKDPLETLAVDPPSIPSSIAIARDHQNNGNGMDGCPPSDLPVSIEEQKPEPEPVSQPLPATSQSQGARDLPNAAPPSSAEAPPEPGLAQQQALALSLIAEHLPEWRNPEIHVNSRDATDLFYLLTWLWLIKRLAEAGKGNKYDPNAYYDEKDTAAYEKRLDGIVDRCGYIVTRTGGIRAGNMTIHQGAPLTSKDLEVLEEAIEQFNESEEQQWQN